MRNIILVALMTTLFGFSAAAKTQHTEVNPARWTTAGPHTPPPPVRSINGAVIRMH
jgi:hypothetical protein